MRFVAHDAEGMWIIKFVLPTISPANILHYLQLFKRNAAYADPSAKAEMQLQGSLLLQSWLKLEKNSVTTSLLALPIPRLITFASDPTASRVIDAFLDEDNKAVAYKDRRAFLRNLIGHYQTLSDDRIGSRVAERCWAVADPFLKVGHVRVCSVVASVSLTTMCSTGKDS